MTKNKDGRPNHWGWGRAGMAGITVAGALVCAALEAAAQPAPNVVAWGTFAPMYDGGFAGAVTAPIWATNVVTAAIGFDHAIAIRADGSVTGWGDDTFGQTDPPPGLGSAVAVSSGSGCSLAVQAGGAVFAWGLSVSQTSLPSGLTEAVTAGAFGAAFSTYGEYFMALGADHTVTLWPAGVHEEPLAGLTNAVAIAGGTWHHLALRSDGTVAVWGEGLDIGANLSVPPGLTNAVAIAAGAYFSMALTAEGTVVAWGDGSQGQTNVPPDLTNAVAIAAGDYHGLALRSDGTVIAWGWDAYGQTNVPAELSNVVSIAAGALASIAILGPAMPPSQVPVTNVAFGAGGFTAAIPTDLGHVYALEYKTSLADTQWTPLPLVAGTGGLTALSDPTASPGQRFYRVRRW